MAGSSKIEWTHATFNPWVGCEKVSPACDHCYAEGWAKRTGSPELWRGQRRRTTAAYWRGPAKWNADAQRAGQTRRVFCASLADVFDKDVPQHWRDDLWALIGTTVHLTWLLLTKRPQNIAGMLPMVWGDGWPNVWLGTTAEDAGHHRLRWAHLAGVPARVRFLSYEPALGPLEELELGRVGAPDWVICGGESGPGAREMDAAWARSVRDQCRRAAVPFFMKQMTRKAPIPADLLVREFPRDRLHWTA